MFGIIDRSNKNCRVFCVMDNRSRESLLPIIKNNVATVMDIKEIRYESQEDIHKYCMSTRIYSDCWAAYQPNDFKEYGFLLHRVNPVVWAG